MERATFSIDDQSMTLGWQMAKALYHEACSNLLENGWSEGESYEIDDQLISYFDKGNAQVKVAWTLI